MSSLKRSTLRLDLKDIAPRTSSPHIGRLGLVAISVVAAVSAVISINSPSASVANVESFSAIEAARAESRPRAIPSNRRSPHPGLAETAKLDRTLPIDSTEADSGASPEPGVPHRTLADKPITLEPVAGMNIPGIVRPTPTGGTEATDARGSRLHLASLAPVIPRETIVPLMNVPLVNLIEAEPSAEDGEDAGSSLDLTLPDAGQETESGTDLAAIHPSPDHPEAENSATLAPVESVDDPVTPEIDPLQQALDEGDWKTEVVRKRDTISQLFNRLDISSREAYALVKLEDAAVLNTIRPGEEIHITTRPPADGKTQVRLEKLKYQVDRFTTLLVQGTDDGYTADIIEREPEIRYRTVRATIWNSLLGAAKKADIPFDVVYSLATVFGWQVDFAKDIQSGDSFTAIYEELYLDGELIDSGQVVAAELVTGDRNLRAVRHVDEDNRVSYYAPDGEGIQGSFLRSPIKFARVTSGFSKRRLHPIKKTWKAHKGVDYGAPMNTPIRSTGDGVVKFVGTKKGYGKTVILRHGEKYQTLYAHMNKFRKGLRSGSRVKQGEIIGYVGRTGWATGPHLHYEFQVAGNHVNPLTVELPKSLPIDKRYRDQFTQVASNWVTRLENAGRIPLAQNER